MSKEYGLIVEVQGFTGLILTDHLKMSIKDYKIG
jgi:hypothetical protein